MKLDMDGDNVDSDGSDTALPNLRRFKDSVHDYMPFGPEICKIIDTPQLQRLRNIKQLGTSYYVWPSASHNRFEHSLGVAYLCQLLAEHLQKSQPGLGITNRDIICVTIAGLCHDLGHGPFSHVWDARFIPFAMPNTTWKHEDASEMMFDALIANNNIDMNPDDVTFIKALIAGEPKRCRNHEEKPFLFEIVSNKRNGLDVDKFDYIARDTHAIGQRVNLSLSRLIHSARVIDNQICYDIKDANQVYELCYTRFSLHKNIYSHKTARAIEYMVVDALMSAEPHMNFAADIFKPQKFLYLTDDIRARIESSESEELAEARAIFHRIATRDLYHRVDWKVFDWDYRDILNEHFTPEKIVRAAKTWAATNPDAPLFENDDELVDALEPRHVIVDTSKMHYGMQDRNPLHSVSFYSKHHPDRCGHAEPGDISTLMPEKFAEVLLRIYTRDTRFGRLIQKGYNELLSEMPNVPIASPTSSRAVSPVHGPAPTPPDTEGSPPPSPPRPRRTFSRVPSTASAFGDGRVGLPPNGFAVVPARPPHSTGSPSKSRKPASKRSREDVKVAGQGAWTSGSPSGKKRKT
ncbi:hypothetical protein B0H21DRAFT_96613 [Amylocystis lapponica]|nr:hypothetical protein B0H21DRAFT_96613 [Amylocystis lapponica]